MQSSAICATPVAPSGCPDPIRPPLGFIIRLCVSYNSCENFAPCPLSAILSASSAIGSQIANASCTSATSTSLDDMPAILVAFCAALNEDLKNEKSML